VACRGRAGQAVSAGAGPSHLRGRDLHPTFFKVNFDGGLSVEVTGFGLDLGDVTGTATQLVLLQGGSPVVTRPAEPYPFEGCAAYRLRGKVGDR
jgi:hypothetical protein